MSNSIVSKKFNELPPEAKKQAQDFVDILYQRYVNNKTKDESTPSSIQDSSFFGIWSDRKEMKDSTEWVKNVRKAQWPNQ